MKKPEEGEVPLREAARDFLKYLQYLETKHLLVRIENEVSTEKDIGDYMYKSSVTGGPALLFENIRSDDLGIRYGMPLAGSVISTRQRAAIALGVEENLALEACISAMNNQIPPKIVQKDPFSRKVFRGDNIDILKILPVAKCSPSDGGKYIGTGLIFANDPEFGRNVAISRHQVLGKNRLGIVVFEPQHTAIYRRRAEERGEPLEVSIVLSCAPDLIIASQFKPAIGVDECRIAGGLRKAPVELVEGNSIGVEFPSSAQIVLEGEIPLGVWEKEGPFGEYTGYYGQSYEKMTVIDVKSVLIRDDISPVYYGSLPMPVENDVIKEIPMEANILFGLRRNCPGTVNVRCPWYGGSEDLVLIQLKKTYEDEGKMAILGAISATGQRPKLVVVVDSDVDIFNEAQVWNAMTYRMQPSKDVTIVRIHGNPLDPSLIKSPDGPCCMGIDATKPMHTKYAERIEQHGMQIKLPEA